MRNWTCVRFCSKLALLFFEFFLFVFNSLEIHFQVAAFERNGTVFRKVNSQENIIRNVNIHGKFKWIVVIWPVKHFDGVSWGCGTIQTRLFFPLHFGVINDSLLKYFRFEFGLFFFLLAWNVIISISQWMLMQCDDESKCKKYGINWMKIKRKFVNKEQERREKNEEKTMIVCIANESVWLSDAFLQAQCNWFSRSKITSTFNAIVFAFAFT